MKSRHYSKRIDFRTVADIIDDHYDELKLVK
jgi:hypothetical protein